MAKSSRSFGPDGLGIGAAEGVQGVETLNLCAINRTTVKMCDAKDAAQWIPASRGELFDVNIF
jgi:hypothetical protein